MNKVYQDETELLYCGTDFGDKAKNPETPPIYNTTAYIVEDTPVSYTHLTLPTNSLV